MLCENLRNELKIMNLIKKINREKGSLEMINFLVFLSNFFFWVVRLLKSLIIEIECVIK